ncbi:transporter substrate-binding domain-containing protein [Parapusillimonas sp. SGNA-6]|jgi:polar amino acid transport system substrate-binding protein|nr:transporter substrate-binding domain-containing protein [Parapusillimonas sp. SGNA-6]
MKTKKGALAGVLFGMLMMLMSAVSNGQSINDIVKRGKVLIGVNSGAPPFSFVDEKGAVMGYDVDTAHLFGKYLGVPVEIVPYTTPARIPALEAGKVDFVIATLSPTPERAKVVMFTMPYSTFQLVVVGTKDSKIKSLEDLAGKKVSVARGTPQEVALTRSAPKGTVYSRFDDDLTAMQALISKQVDAVAVPETIFKTVMKTRPDADLAIRFPFFNQYMSIAVRKDAFELRQWLNSTLSYIKQNGELDDLAVKWTGHKLPKDMPVF